MRRLIALYRTAARYRLDQLLPLTQRPRLLVLLLQRFPGHVGRHEHTQRGAAATCAFEDLGPSLCQIRAAAVDTPRSAATHDIADELALLQDQVAPFPANEAIQRIEQALGKPTELSALPNLMRIRWLLRQWHKSMVRGLPRRRRCGGEGLAARYRDDHCSGP